MSSDVFATADMQRVGDTLPLATHIVKRVVATLKSDAGGLSAAGPNAPRRVRSIAAVCLYSDSTDADEGPDLEQPTPQQDDRGGSVAAVAEAAGAFQRLALQIVEALCSHAHAADQSASGTSSYSVHLSANCVADGGDTKSVSSLLMPLTSTGWPSLDPAEAVGPVAGPSTVNVSASWSAVGLSDDPFLAATSTALLVPKHASPRPVSHGESPRPNGPANDALVPFVVVPRPVIGSATDAVPLAHSDPFVAAEVIVRAVDGFTRSRVANQKILADLRLCANDESFGSSPDLRISLAAAAAVLEPAVVVQISVARARVYTPTQHEQLKPPATAVVAHAMVTLVFAATHSQTGQLFQHIARAQQSSLRSQQQFGRKLAALPPALPVPRSSLAWYMGLLLHEALVLRTSVFTLAALSPIAASAQQWLADLHAAIHPPPSDGASNRQRQGVGLSAAIDALSVAMNHVFGDAAEPEPTVQRESGSPPRASVTAFVEVPVGCAATSAVTTPSGAPCVPRSLLTSGDAYFVLAMADAAIVRAVLPLVNRSSWLRHFLRLGATKLPSRATVFNTSQSRTECTRDHAHEQLRRTLVGPSDVATVVLWAADMANVSGIEPGALANSSDRRRADSVMRFSRCMDGTFSSTAAVSREATEANVSRRSTSSIPDPLLRVTATPMRGGSRGSLRPVNDDSEDDAPVAAQPLRHSPTPMKQMRPTAMAGGGSNGGDAAGLLWLSSPTPGEALAATTNFISVTPPPPESAREHQQSQAFLLTPSTKDASVGRDGGESSDDESCRPLDATAVMVPIQPRKNTIETADFGAQCSPTTDSVSVQQPEDLSAHEEHSSYHDARARHHTQKTFADVGLDPTDETYPREAMSRPVAATEHGSDADAPVVAGDDDEPTEGTRILESDVEELLEALKAWKDRAMLLEDENDVLLAKLTVAQTELRQKQRDGESEVAAGAEMSGPAAAAPPPNETDAPSALNELRDQIAELERDLANARNQCRDIAEDMDAAVERVTVERDRSIAGLDAARAHMHQLRQDCDMWRLAAEAARDAKAELAAQLELQRRRVSDLEAAASSSPKAAPPQAAPTPGLVPPAESAPRPALGMVSVGCDATVVIESPRAVLLISAGVDPVAELNPARRNATCEPPPPTPIKVAASQCDALPVPSTTNRASSPVAELAPGLSQEEAAALKRQAQTSAITIQALQAELESAARDKMNLAVSLRGAGSALREAEARVAAGSQSEDRIQRLEEQNSQLRLWVEALRAEGEKLVAAAQSSERERANLINLNESLRALGGMAPSSAAAGGATSPSQAGRPSSGLRDDQPSPLLRRPATVAPGTGLNAPQGPSAAGHSHHHIRSSTPPASSRTGTVSTAQHQQQQPTYVIPSSNPTMTGQLSYITPLEQRHFGGFFNQGAGGSRQSPPAGGDASPGVAPATAAARYGPAKPVAGGRRPQS